jgi:hypothetical protein
MDYLLKRIRFFMFLMAIVAVVAMAQIYRWVDEEGNVHFGDRAPENSVAESIEMPESPSTADVRSAQEIQEQIKQQIRILDDHRNDGQVVEKDAQGQPTGLANQADRQCVEALYQLKILGQVRRVYKLNADGSRFYLSDDARPAEIKRIERIKMDRCSEDSRVFEKQLRRAVAMYKALSPRCTDAREELDYLERSKERTNRTPADDLEKKRSELTAYIDQNCPETPSKNLWIRDWIIVRH